MAESGPAARRGRSATAGGVDSKASKRHLMEVAKELDVHGRSRMDKGELVKAIDKANRRESSRSLRKERRS